jgi:hypothetical protein
MRLLTTEEATSAGLTQEVFLGERICLLVGCNFAVTLRLHGRLVMWKA